MSHTECPRCHAEAEKVYSEDELLMLAHQHRRNARNIDRSGGAGWVRFIVDQQAIADIYRRMAQDRCGVGCEVCMGEATQALQPTGE